MSMCTRYKQLFTLCVHICCLIAKVRLSDPVSPKRHIVEKSIKDARLGEIALINLLISPIRQGFEQKPTCFSITCPMRKELGI